ncbi:Nif3-like dinuclear metal center hexameric protein [Corynebacterium sp. ES2715-CONJ3]|uniref:Nif3-like dinuclear metal center hexameric protein n=1 Tax=Corynebacterium sp. ES2715-CONJ3 TaxID=2974028 RepID=UPI002168A17B|nr:Nif3-like dinuclear metal center hexameric protein [Corynebacterium sp. ES2715-CONJ3]MCS4492392.1 Nif3-like dinuclear metal center hexameric protein [Corynebacterium sp. ES2715-CONJ3]
MMHLKDIIRTLDQAYPPHLAESWDAVGLVCGDLEAEVKTICLALDCTDDVVDQAIARGADLIITHHPLLMRGVTSVAAHTPKGRIVHALIRSGCALFSAHTNADSARPGVNDKLAELVGITPGRPIAPQLDSLDKWGVHIPPEHATNLKEALFAIGAGAIGGYTECAFQWEGQGEFRAGTYANPTIGTAGEKETLKEVRIEFVAARGLRARLMDTLRSAHPYEEPAFDITPLAPTTQLDSAPGLGRIGELPEPMRFADFVQQVANALPETVWGIRAAGDPERMVQTIAVSSGSGDSFLEKVRQLGVDVYLTSDLRHHPVDEHLRAGGPLVIDTAHWASEYPWTLQAQEILRQAHPELDIEVLNCRTDPWTLSAHPEH